MWQSVLNKVLNNYIKDEKAFLLASIAMRMPNYIAIDLSSHVWESLNECEYWENGGSYYDEDFFGEIFNPLMPYINIKDVGALWERAKHEFEEETWGGQQALMAVLKNWMFFDDEQGYIKEVQDDMVNYFKSLLPEELHYRQKMIWAEIRIKQLEAISDAETLFNGWFEIYKIALTLRPDWARDREIYNKFLENCGEALPPKITLRIWSSLINDYAMKIAEQEDKGGQHWQYEDPLISLIKKVPKEHALKTMQLAFKFKTKYPSLFINIFPHTIGQLLIRINDESKQYWWNKAKEETFNKYYGTHAFSVLLQILREVPETKWKKKQLEHLIDELIKHFDDRYLVLVQDYFPYIPESSRSIALKKILAKVSSHDNVDVFLVELLGRQPEFIQHIMEIIDNQEKKHEILKSVTERGWGWQFIYNSDAFKLFLQNISKHDQKVIWELISPNILSKKHVAIETLVIFFEYMTNENREQVLPEIISNSWNENEAEKYFALAIKNWSGKTIWKVWQYMYNFDPNREWPYCLWALALAPHIPTNYVSQAFEMALQHTYPRTWWPWKEISITLAMRLPNQFADSMWSTLRELILEIENSSIRRDLRQIQVALIASVSDDFLISILKDGFSRNQTLKKFFTKTNIIGGNTISYFRPLFLLSFPKKIPTPNKNDTLLSRILSQYKKVHKVHRKIAGIGSIIFASMIALTYPVIFPILRFLYKCEDDDSCHLPFFFDSIDFVAKNISNRFSILFSGRGRYFSRFFSKHVEFSEEKISKSHVVQYFYKEVTDSNMPEWLQDMILLTIILLKMLSFKNILLGVQFVISIPLGIILSFITFLIRFGLFIFFIDIFAIERFFGNALSTHLHISKSSTRNDLLQKWLNNEKEYDVFALRPLFDQAGGKKLRRIAAIAYQDANTWWYDVIANPQNIFGKDGV